MIYYEHCDHTLYMSKTCKNQPHCKKQGAAEMFLKTQA